jgi:lipoyl-dependent peroxiredoxin
MAKNEATAKWTGAIKEGNGQFKLGGGAAEGQFSYKSRFEDGVGTNPEELIAAAHAACFSMATAAQLGEAGIEPESIETTAHVKVGIVDGAPTITTSALTTTVTAPGADEAKVREAADGAKAGCPVSKALAGVKDITLDLTVNV